LGEGVVMSNRDLALANAVTHGTLSDFLPPIYIGCERCGNPHMLIVTFEEEKPKNEMEDIILQSNYFLKCPECGFEEADAIMTVIPSWMWHQYRAKMPKTGKQVFEEKIKIARGWFS
jgi:hypothetical protein